MTWERAAVALAVVALAALAARLVDRRIAARARDPELLTRYRVLRRMAAVAIIAVGVLSALLTIPAVRTVAGAALASSAVVALVIGFAAQRTLSNAVAGVLIALTQPLPIGDRVEVDEQTGVVEEIGLTYTFILLDDRSRLAIPNDKLASDTIRNSTIVSREKVAEITVQVPLTRELGPVVELVRRELADRPGAEVFVSALDEHATLAVRAPAPDEAAADLLQRELRLRVHERLRAAGALE